MSHYTTERKKMQICEPDERASCVGMSMIGDRFLPKKYEAPIWESPAYGGSRRRPEQAGLSGTHMTARYSASTSLGDLYRRHTFGMLLDS